MARIMQGYLMIVGKRRRFLSFGQALALSIILIAILLVLLGAFVPTADARDLYCYCQYDPYNGWLAWCCHSGDCWVDSGPYGTKAECEEHLPY